MFDELYIFNYFPTDIGEAETHTKKISTLKMNMIHAIMGEDTKVLTSEEELRSYFKEEYERMQGESEQKSWDTDYRANLNQLIGSDEMKEALKLPLRTKTRRKTENELPEGVLIFAKKGMTMFLNLHLTKIMQQTYRHKMPSNCLSAVIQKKDIKFPMILKSCITQLRKLFSERTITMIQIK